MEAADESRLLPSGLKHLDPGYHHRGSVASAEATGEERDEKVLGRS